jgi:hypothetical protein
VVLPDELIEATWPHSLGKRLPDEPFLRACREQVHRSCIPDLRRAVAVSARRARARGAPAWTTAPSSIVDSRGSQPGVEKPVETLHNTTPALRSFCRTEYGPSAW